MAYDSQRGVVVLFGGKRPQAGAGTLLGDTWEWNGKVWTQRNVTGPAPRYLHEMCYDEQRSVVVLFGGGGSGGATGTWEWNGDSWVFRTIQGPHSRQGHSLIYDSHHRESILFGGMYDMNQFLEFRDLWSWDGTTWTLRSADSIGRRYYHAMTYDTVRRKAVLFSGYNGFVYVNSTRLLTLESPGITQDPSDAIVHPASTVLFHVEAEDLASLQYQWRKNGIPLTDHAHVHDSTTPTLRIQPATPPDEGLYDCIISNACGDIISRQARLTIQHGHHGADINQDGHVNVSDMLMVISAWGACDSASTCAEDIDPPGGDEVVDVSDLLAVLLGWGP